MSASTATRAPAVDARGLGYTFGRGRRTVVAVESVDLQLAAGEIVALLGPNGAGKTTTLRLLATLLPIMRGTAVVAGADVRREPQRVRQRIGYVPQGGSADPAETGRRELIFQARLYGLSAAEARGRAAALLERFDLVAAADRPSGTYSGGMRRRLDIALGIVHRPSVLLLDEPTIGLDPEVRARLWDEIRLLRDDGATVVLTTHYLEEADALADRVVIIDRGRVVAEGTPEALKQSVGADVLAIRLRGVPESHERAAEALRAVPAVRDIRPGEALVRLYVERAEAALPQILKLLDGSGLAVETVTITRPTLNEVFLQRTGRSLRDPDEPID